MTDALNTFSDNQVITGTGNILATKSIDLGPTGTTARGDTPVSDPGRAFHGKLDVQVTANLAGGASLQAQLVTADNSAMSTNLTVIQETAAIPLTDLKTGYRFALGALPPGITQRYLGIRYVASGTFTGTGKITASLVWDKATNIPH